MESIKDTIFKFLRLDNLMTHLTGYVEARIELLKVEIREEVAKVLASALVLIIVIFLALIFLLFLSVGLANYLNVVLESEHAGFWIVAGVYGLPCLIFVLFRKQISHSAEARVLKSIKRKKS